MRTAVKLLISTLPLGVLAASVDVGDALSQAGRIGTGYILAAGGFFYLTHLINAAKLHLLMPERRLPLLFAFILASQAYVMVLPGQFGADMIKILRLARAADVARAVSSVAFDKLTGIGGTLLLVLAGILAEPGLFGTAGLWVVGGALAVLAGLLALPAWGGLPALVRGLAGAGQGWRRRLVHGLDRMLVIWRGHAGRTQTVVLSLIYGVAAQSSVVAGSLVLGLGCGIELGFAQWSLVIGALSVVLLAPVTLGGIGLREASLVGFLGFLGIDSERALAVALAILAFHLLITATGLAVNLLILREH